MFFARLPNHRSDTQAWAHTQSAHQGGLSSTVSASWVFIAIFLLGLFAGCSSPKLADSTPTESTTPAHASQNKVVPTFVSLARTPKEYRQDAAKHIYGFNQHRIHKGKLPPLLYAIGVVTFEVNEDGKIQSFDWMRKPKQAPEVIQEIERTIKAAEPFPAPVHLGRVRYTETWLWHKSGMFQLDTLTEGQI